MIPTSSNKFLKLKLQQIFSPFKLISKNFLGEKHRSKKKTQRRKQKPSP